MMSDGTFGNHARLKHDLDASAIPWQIWVVVALLAAEGLLNNVPLILRYPMALVWLAGKALFITGLLRRWRWVYVLSMAVTALHVVAFISAPYIAFINLMLLALQASAWRFYFPKRLLH